MSIPDVDGESGYLPGGDHEATLEEVRDRYGYNFRRREILDGLEHILEKLWARGVREVWLDGSFVTDRQRPGDVDVVYMPPLGSTEDWDDVGPSQRHVIKARWRVDLWRFPSPQRAKGPLAKFSTQPITIKEFFESDADGDPKGLIRLTGWGRNDSK